ncbi:hypothetical protein DFH08DRAFT_1082971 [Mycena albidolilacea]|uniref:Uncharacterized protein n=1 Tax=Mycena albidolilacea TaxID=1033008 RepID=A0AAD6ZSK3_9AGAR|nr:hypothetical protein DFH08DRAFT_1082971 [Mycena albidolilacea]
MDAPLPECLESTHAGEPCSGYSELCAAGIGRPAWVRFRRYSAYVHPRSTKSSAGFHPEFDWMEKQLRERDCPARARVVVGLDFSSVNMEVHAASVAEGDPSVSTLTTFYIRPSSQQTASAHKTQTVPEYSLLQGFSNLHSNKTSSWHPTSHTLPRTWTVRVVGSGTGNFIYILVQGAVHFVDPTIKDQPALAKKVVDHWVANEPLF